MSEKFNCRLCCCCKESHLFLLWLWLWLSALSDSSMVATLSLLCLLDLPSLPVCSGASWTGDFGSRRLERGRTWCRYRRGERLTWVMFRTWSWVWRCRCCSLVSSVSPRLLSAWEPRPPPASPPPLSPGGSRRSGPTWSQSELSSTSASLPRSRTVCIGTSDL